MKYKYYNDKTIPHVYRRNENDIMEALSYGGRWVDLGIYHEANYIECADLKKSFKIYERGNAKRVVDSILQELSKEKFYKEILE